MPVQETTIAVAETRNIQSGGNVVESLEWWSSVFNGSVVVLTGLLALVGFFAWKYSSDLAALKDAELVRFKLESSERTKTIEVALEAQRERAANAERALIELQEKLKPRILTDEQRNSLIKDLTAFKGQRLEITEYKQSGEAWALSSQIQSALVLANWEVSITGETRGSVEQKGVLIMVDLGEKNVAAAALTAALRKVDITTAFLANDGAFPFKLGPGVIGMFVGPKS